MPHLWFKDNEKCDAMQQDGAKEIADLRFVIKMTVLVINYS